MAEHRYHDQRDEQLIRTTGGTLTLHVSGKSMLCASLAGVAIGGPLFAMTGFSFLATVTLVLISSPLLLIFSPLLFGSAFVFVGALTGFTAAMGMAVAGFLSLAWIYRRVRENLGLGLGFRGYGRMKEGQDFGGYLQQRVEENSSQSQSHEHENRLIKVE